MASPINENKYLLENTQFEWCAIRLYVLEYKQG